MDIAAAAPDGFSEGERVLFSALVRQGGEVGENTLATNLKAAKVLVFGKIAGEVLGIAALKRPQASYRNRIGGKAGVEIGPAGYPYELGYVFLLPEAQGKKLSHGPQPSCMRMMRPSSPPRAPIMLPCWLRLRRPDSDKPERIIAGAARA